MKKETFGTGAPQGGTARTKDPLTQCRDYRKLTDEELFPVLMKRPAADRESGRLTEEYRNKAEEVGDKYYSGYRKAREFTSVKAELDFRSECLEAGDWCWSDMNKWLNEKLANPDEVDSFPEDIMDFGTATTTIASKKLSAEGREQLEAIAERRRQYESDLRESMREWNEKRDVWERAINTASSSDSALLTDEELHLQGKLSSEAYSDSKFQRDYAEAEERRKLESELARKYGVYDVEAIDYETSVIKDMVPLRMNYFFSMENCIKKVKSDWDVNEVFEPTGKFYRMLWPVYAAGHKKKPMQRRSVRVAIWSFVKIIISIGLFVLIRILDKNLHNKDDILGFLGVLAAAGTVIMGIVTIIVVISGVSKLRSAFDSMRRIAKVDVKNQAKLHAPALYRQLRYYKLWAKNGFGVDELEKILDTYYNAAQ